MRLKSRLYPLLAMPRKSKTKINRSRNRPLTPQQLKCLKALNWYIRKHGVAPTQEELSAMLGLESKQGSKNYLVALENKGYIARKVGAWRGVEVLVHPVQAEKRSRKMKADKEEAKRARSRRVLGLPHVADETEDVEYQVETPEDVGWV